jgi:hypothetical protein
MHRLCGGNAIPDGEIGVVYAFLSILVLGEHVVGDLIAVVAVLGICLRNGLFRTPKIQVNDLSVGQVSLHSFLGAAKFPLPAAFTV